MSTESCKIVSASDLAFFLAAQTQYSLGLAESIVREEMDRDSDGCIQEEEKNHFIANAGYHGKFEKSLEREWDRLTNVDGVRQREFHLSIFGVWGEVMGKMPRYYNEKNSSYKKQEKSAVFERDSSSQDLILALSGPLPGMVNILSSFELSYVPLHESQVPGSRKIPHINLAMGVGPELDFFDGIVRPFLLGMMVGRTTMEPLKLEDKGIWFGFKAGATVTVIEPINFLGAYSWVGGLHQIYLGAGFTLF